MFTGSIKKGKWNYMFLAAAASLVVAALATLASARRMRGGEDRSTQQFEQSATGRYMHNSETTMVRFVN